MKILVIKNLIATHRALLGHCHLAQTPQRSLLPQGECIRGREPLARHNTSRYILPTIHYFGALR